MTASLVRELPTPSRMPEKASRATGSIKVLPRLCRNSQIVDLAGDLAICLILVK
ncbi:hypothetical protein D3C80_1297820 [compost metagenome]